MGNINSSDTVKPNDDVYAMGENDGTNELGPTSINILVRAVPETVVPAGMRSDGSNVKYK